MVYLCEYLTRPGAVLQTAQTSYGKAAPVNAYGIRILECRSLDSLAALPDEINGFPVTELAPYLFAVQGSYDNTVPPGAFWWSDTEAAAQSENLWQDVPVLRGSRLEELRLPARLEKVGAYALYNCEKLKKLELYSTTLDWGAGVFTGCQGVRQMTIHVDEGSRSCMREVLAELRQTLEVRYLPQKPAAAAARRGAWPDPLQPDAAAACALLIFPEFFEEAVENTPARILVTETHGCGQKYRNAFVRTQFQMKEYDSLFPHVQVQEPEELVSELALGRLMYPYQLEERYAKRYREYLSTHTLVAAGQAIQNGDMQALEWIFAHIPCDGEMIVKLLDIAGACRDGSAVSFLMERNRAEGAVKRKRFSLC